ncbi:MAG: RHS repeat-associated core domain-containing protein [Candidatus Binataceae bacterium]
MSYAYDSASRLTQLSYGTGGAGSSDVGTLTYSYDAEGRVISKGGTLAATTLPANVNGNSFNADNAMTGFNGQTLSYDANGNLTNDGTNAYAWDARNHLSGLSGGVTASFLYDPFGRRSSKIIGGAATQFLYDGLNPVQELDGASPPNVTANLITGFKIDEYFTRTDSSGAATFLSDALGSTLGLTNSSGSIATSYTYDPFGNVSASGTANANPYQFTGRENDATGLYFHRARYYSPTYQRFIAQDPIGFSGGDLNLYAFVQNQPTSHIDSQGTQPDRECNAEESFWCSLSCPHGVLSCTVPQKYVTKFVTRGIRGFERITTVDAGPAVCDCADPPASSCDGNSPAEGPMPGLPPLPVLP